MSPPTSDIAPPAAEPLTTPASRSARRRTQLLREVRRCLLSSGAAGQRLVVGCSGGPDSTALLLALSDLASELSLTLHVVAVDHQLRQAAADEAAAVCRLANRLALSAEVVAVVVGAGASLQAQARVARYAALAQVAARQAARFIAVGHTRDDQSETVLMRLLAGAGLSGLSAMAPLAPLPVPGSLAAPPQLIRPLLAVSRRQIESLLLPLAGQLGPLPTADPSNADPHYLRSRLRHQLLPQLRQLAPHLDAHLLALSSQLRADAQLLDAQAAAALLGLGGQPLQSVGSLRLSATALLALPLALQARVVRLATGGLLGQRQVDAVLRLCQPRSGRPGRQSLDLPHGLRAERDHDQLHLHRTAPPQLD